MSTQGHKHSTSTSQNHRAQLANAYNELGKELSSAKIRVIGNYTLGRVIGEGAYGKVRLGTHRLTSVRVAIKQIPKEMSSCLTREIHHHRRLHHPHVTQLYEVIATEHSIWLVTELCSGGELFDYLAEKGRLSEDESRTIFGQLCLAVGYIHEKGVVHRDLKLENVLLDERCRVKLGDFGFTREFDKNSLLETQCGTTGYAAPEMLRGKKYHGPEVDVWSLGVILYCLLTGSLPFDDDDENGMMEKILIGNFEVPEWLSADAGDLIRNILQQEPSKRLSISQILAHPWFTRPQSHNTSASTASTSDNTLISPSSLPVSTSVDIEENPMIGYKSTNIDEPSPSPATSETSFHSASSELSQSTPTTPDDSVTYADTNQSIDFSLQPNSSLSTLKERSRKGEDGEDVTRKMGKSSMEENSLLLALSTPRTLSRDPSPSPQDRQHSHPPSTYPTRTPARTKRRSVSSVLSQPSSPTTEGPTIKLPPQNYASLLSTPAPLLFSTPLERNLLNSLNMLGFDIGQMVHSVLSNACDSSGALWWMLKRKAEKKAVEESMKRMGTEASLDAETEAETVAEREKTAAVLMMASASSRGDLPLEPRLTASESAPPPLLEKDSDKTPNASRIDSSRSAPQLAFVPPTPTLPKAHQKQTEYRPITPPRSKSPRSLLTPTPSLADSLTGTATGKSTPTTPGSSTKSKEGKEGKGFGKQRSGSVSIMQRATTALEAAGLVRKRSAEAVKEREDREREKRASDEKEKEEKEKEKIKNASGPSKLQKSPPLKPVKDKDGANVPPAPSTPEREKDITASSSLTQSSPWVIARSSTFAAPTPTNTPAELSIGNDELTTTTTSTTSAPGKASAGGRNRTSILSTFRTWFNEDRKGKRKASLSMHSPPSGMNAITPSSSVTVRNRGVGSGTVKRGSGWGGQSKGRAGKRASISSRRSSSVNSRRSSINSVHMIGLESPHHNVTIDHMTGISRQRSDPSRRSFTPNSEFERDKENYSSRPSSIHSFSMKTRHRKSPSTSSAGSVARMRNGSASPLQKYHRRMGSSSSTRVVRQSRPTASTSGSSGNLPQRPPHMRSNSTASSIHSKQSSRPGSFYDASEGEGQGRSGSPLPRRSLDDTPRKNMYNTVLVAQKQRSPFLGPPSSLFSVSHGMSWKKSWGTEPPGWSSRTAQLPVEVLSISPPTEQTVIRDVFSGRQSISLGDESDWVDEDDEIPTFAGGLGQVPASSTSAGVRYEPPMLSPPPRSNARTATKKTTRNIVQTHRTANPTTRLTVAARSKPGHSPVVGTMSLPGCDGVFDSHGQNDIAEPRMTRRQLPAGRSGPAFKHAIQEEDEGEEEE